MSLDTNYFLLYPLQQYFVDKTSGLPLSNGSIYFYSDVNRTTPKTVYKYDSVNGYTALPNPVQLSGVGTPTDGNGNDIAIYVFPYTDSTASVIELYYIVVKDSNGLTQLTRESIPNIESNTNGNDTTLINYVPNGQFLLHNNIPATGTTTAGTITTSVTEIGEGGWSYFKDPASTSTDTVTFLRYNAYTDIPGGTPRYAVRITSTAVSNKRSLRLKFRDVNKFSGSNQFTFAFYAISNSGSDLSNVEFNLIKNYGTGGSSPNPEEPIFINSFTIPTPANIKNNGIINNVFTFGTTVGKTLGTNDDDYLQLEIQLPNASVDITLTDFVLTPDSVTVTNFPVTTTAKFVEDSLAGWLPVPDYNAQNLGLPVILTSTGLGFSSADIGKVNAGLYNTPNFGELLCDGSRYETAAYSSDGIPYSRLQAILFNQTSLTPMFGTGAGYITGTYTGLASGINSLRISSNTVGTATFSLGTTGFSSPIVPLATGAHTPNTGCKGYLHDGGIIVIATTQGAGTVADGSVATGFTFTVLKNRLYTGSLPQAYFAFDIDLSVIPTAGSYFTFTNQTDNFYVWFTVDGVGTDPAIGGSTGIQINIVSTWNISFKINEIARVLREAISGYQVAQYTFPDYTGITGGTYFSVTTTTPTTYYIWYTKDGIGNDPFPNTSSSQKIRVDILTNDTAATVTTKTLSAINSKYFAVPDLRGMFLRGADPTGVIDIEHNINRMSVTDYIPSNYIGTTELDQFFQHNHPGSTVTNYNPGTAANTVSVGGTSSSTAPINVAIDGGTETRPYNMYVNYFIKY